MSKGAFTFMKIFKGFLIAASVIFVILVLPEIITFNFLKPIVLPQVEKALGRPVHIDGNIHVRLTPYMRLIVDGLRVENVKGAHQKDFATVDSIIINVDFIPLLWKKVTTNIRITNPKIYLESFGKDKNNWTFGGEEKSETNEKEKPEEGQKETGWKVKIQSLKVGDALVEYRDRKVVNVYEFATVGMGASSLKGPFYINGRLYFDYQKYDFSLRTSRAFGKTAARVLVKFREAGDKFNTLFRGNMITEPFAIKGTFEGAASMLKLKLDHLLLKDLALNPMSHVSATAEVESTEKLTDIKNMKVNLPITSILAQAAVTYAPYLKLKVDAHVPDQTSYLKVETQKQPEGLRHSFDFKMAKMAELLKLYKIATPIPNDSNLVFKGDFVQKEESFVLHETALTLERAKVNTSMNITPLSKERYKVSAQVAVPDMDHWRRIFNINVLPGLGFFKTNFQASGNEDKLSYDIKLHLDDDGVVESTGTLIQKQILKAKVRAHYKEAKELAYHLNAKRMKDLGPFTIACDVDSNKDTLKITNMRLDTKPIAGKGSILVKTRGENKDIKVNMNCETLDIWNLLNFRPADTQVAPTKGEDKSSEAAPIGWSKEKIEWPRNYNVDMDLQVKNVSFFQPIMNHSRLQLTMKPDLKMTLEGKSALTQKDCNIRVQFLPGDSKHQFKTSGFFNQIPIFPFMQLATTAVKFGGGLTAKLDISTKGRSVDDFMKSLNGFLNVQADGAFIDGYNLRKLSRNPASISGMLFNTIFRQAAEGKGLGLFDIREQKGENTPVKILKSDVRLSGGNATLHNTVLDAEGVNGSIAGNIDIGERLLNLKGQMVFPEIKLKDVPALLFTLTGSFDNPKSENNLDKFVQYFISNVLVNLAGKTLGSLLLNAIVPGLGVVASVVGGQIADAAADSPSPAPAPATNDKSVSSPSLATVNASDVGKVQDVPQ